jgi:hypothetical protein
MYISFEELRKYDNLLVEEKYVFYKINRIYTEAKYAGLLDSSPSWYRYYEYFDKVKEYRISYNPGIEPIFCVYFYKNNYCIALLILKILQNRQIKAYFDIDDDDDDESTRNPSLIKDFQIELYKRLRM